MKFEFHIDEGGVFFRCYREPKPVDPIGEAIRHRIEKLPMNRPMTLGRVDPDEIAKAAIDAKQLTAAEILERAMAFGAEQGPIAALFYVREVRNRVRGDITSRIVKEPRFKAYIDLILPVAVG